METTGRSNMDYLTRKHVINNIEPTVPRVSIVGPMPATRLICVTDIYSPIFEIEPTQYTVTSGKSGKSRSDTDGLILDNKAGTEGELVNVYS